MAADGGGWQYRLREQRRALLGFLAALQPLLAAGMMRAAAFERERESETERGRGQLLLRAQEVFRKRARFSFLLAWPG